LSTAPTRNISVRTTLNYTQWVPVSLGALDVRDELGYQEAEILVIPVAPSPMLALNPEASALWRQLIGGPVCETTLNETEQKMLREFGDYGIASTNEDHSFRVRKLSKSWMLSPQHELVYALISSLMKRHSVDGVFIKGPVLAAQALREKKHSGDVDVWGTPECLELLEQELPKWGWSIQPDVWRETSANHSTTFIPSTWGCEIDLHREFPGFNNVAGKELLDILDNSHITKFATAEGRVPAPVHNAIIASLHLLRPEVGYTVSENRIFEAAEILKSAGPETYEEACKLNVAVPLRPALRTVFKGLDLPPIDEGEFDWGWRAAPSRAVAYMRILASTPAKSKARIAWSLLWPGADVIRSSDVAAGNSTRSLLFARVKRFVRGIRDFIAPRRS